MARIVAFPFSTDFSDLEGNASSSPQLVGTPPTISTAQSKFYNASLLIPGTNDAVLYPTVSGLNFGAAGDWTVQFYFRPSTIASGNRTILHFFNGAGSTARGLHIYQSGASIRIDNGQTAHFVGGTVAANTWQFFRVSRFEGTIFVSIDGVSIGSLGTQDYGDANSTIRFSEFSSPAGTANYTGHIQDLVVDVGVAYSTNADTFTPPLQIGVPNVIGETQANAITILEAAGYTVVSQTALSTAANLGLVVAQQSTGETEVTISVGAGGGALVPDVDGLTEAAAIESAGFVASSKASYSTGTIGDVFAQSPDAGTLLATGSTVQILYTSTNTPPAEITTWTELNAIRLNLAGDYVLMNDLLETDLDYVGIANSGSNITSSGNGWIPIGSAGAAFTGSFDGQGFRIKGLTCNRVESGFFGVIQSATISNVVLEGFTSHYFGGSIQASPLFLLGVATLPKSIISDCVVRDTNIVSKGNVTAFCMGVWGCEVRRCYTKGGTITSTQSNAGGFCANVRYAGDVIDKCFSEDITIIGALAVGGFSFANYSGGTGTISNCYSKNTITPGSKLCGGFNSRISNTIVNSYSASTFTGGLAGGFSGINGGSLSTCYYDSTVSGKTDTNGGSQPKTTTEMYQEATFVDWDFTDIWHINEGNDYPRLISIDLIAVPNIVGQTQAAAEALITGAMLTVGTVTEAFSETVPAGVVISQDPVADTEVAFGSAVDFVVSLGPASATMPNLIGLTDAQARAAIAAANLTVLNVITLVNRPGTLYTVIRQAPPAGTVLEPGSGVEYGILIPPPLPTDQTDVDGYKTVIGYDNILSRDGVTVTASSTATGTFVENLWDGNTYDFWRSNGGMS